jgi:membrane-associated phospholipid phosphatase
MRATTLPAPAVTPRPHASAVRSVLSLLAGAGALALLYAGLRPFAGWMGHKAVQPGPWLPADEALYGALNGPALRPLTDVLFSLLNDPGPAYFAVIVVLLAYCGWRRRAALPAAAVAIGVALALGQAATQEIHHAGHRERPFLNVAEAVTPIASCSSPVLLTLRGAAGPTASCDGSPAALTGLDWRDVWVQFPSFPSGHMRETAALSLLLAGFWRASWPYALAYVLIMGFSRVHLGAHYPSDVLGGALIGLWSGAITLLGLDVARRVVQALYGLPPVRATWDWVARTRVAGRPDLDPGLARLLRSAAYVAAVFLTLYVLGFALVSGQAGQLYSVLQNADYSAFGALTSRFDPNVGRAIYLVLGPAGLLYAALSIAALAAPLALRRSSARRAAAFAVLSLAVTVALSLAIQYVGSRWFERPQPFIQEQAAPIPAEWRTAWQAATSYPNWHVLLIAALAGLLLPLGRSVAVTGQAVALAAVVAAVYAGASWLTDALASYALGTLAAAAGRYVVRQAVPVPGTLQQPSPPTDAGTRAAAHRILPAGATKAG